MNIYIRCDGGIQIGTGHIIRQLMIANELKKAISGEIEFLMKDIPEGISKVEKKGFTVHKIPKRLTLHDEANFIINNLKFNDGDLLLVDILDTSKIYISTLKNSDLKIVSFDDHSEAKYIVNLRFNILELDKEVSASNLFEGPKYVTLDPVFHNYHVKEKNIRKNANKVIITFGGSDPANLTNKTLRALEKVNKKLEIDLVLGFAFSYIKELEINLKKSKHKVNVYKNISALKMAELMFENDIGIGAGGLTQYEFVCIGIPALIICEDVEHQFQLANWFENKDALINLGMGKYVSEDIVAIKIEELCNNYLKRQNLSKNAKKLCDGKGLERTVEKILDLLQLNYE